MTLIRATPDWTGLLAATRTLRDKASSRQPIRFPPDALQSINPIARQRLGQPLYDVVREHWDEGAKAFNLCKAGHLVASGQAFEAAQQRLLQLTDEAQLLVEVMLNTKLAYYQYRTNQFSAAEASIARVLVIDDALQRWYPALHGHKLHVLQNRARTLAVRKQFDEGARLVLNILHYLIAPRHKPYQTGQWGTRPSRHCAALQPAHAKFESALFDLCRDCLRYPAFETAVILHAYPLVKALQKVAHQSDVYRSTLDWLLAKRALYVQGSVNGYIRQSIHFLTAHSERYDVLKLLLLWDATRVAHLSDQVEEKKVITAFINDYYQLTLVD